ncbi:chaperone NapD [Denitratisoma oestradiolicum]|uniref:Chaperone NapD n=1 Tax=Denitratisoma oestradiolicum TaxID=311182 RepID=A0A6S6XX67_9PROT|nr:chaperone NapD [Denitratisoma oestradiolicum]CAB1370619.1 Chaperone NapD [Denitratisoma oestradiolicum]
MNISSAILHALPGDLASLQQQLRELPGVEIHATADKGKLIISIETPGDLETTSIFEAIGKLPQVLSASLVYHQTESDPDKELCYETDAA